MTTGASLTKAWVWMEPVSDFGKRRFSRAGLGPNGDSGSSVRDFGWAEERIGNGNTSVTHNLKWFSSKRAWGNGVAARGGGVKACSQARGDRSGDEKTLMVAGEGGEICETSVLGQR